jgi:hypothetical protein
MGAVGLLWRPVNDPLASFGIRQAGAVVANSYCFHGRFSLGTISSGSANLVGQRNSVALLMIAGAVGMGSLVIHFSLKSASVDINVTSTPSIFDLYANSFPKENLRIDGFTILDIAPGRSWRINYSIIGDFSSNTKFAVFYLPHSKDTVDMIKFIKTDAKMIIDSIDSNISLNTKDIMNTSSVSLKDFVYSGTIYVYYEDEILDTALSSQITSDYKHDANILQLRSSEFKLKIWNEIKLGRVPPMKRYMLKDNGRIAPYDISK